MDYSQIYMRLNHETACAIFVKRDGTIRTMLCTRNNTTMHNNGNDLMGRLVAYDRRCNINNRNIAVYDLVLGDVRSFNTDRLIDTEWYGILETKEQLDEAHIKFKEFDRKYKAEMPQQISMDMLKDTGY
jgi:hypothetical protein